MPRRRPVMSEELKYEIAAELGILDKVMREGWGNVTSRQCGNMVKKLLNGPIKLSLKFEAGGRGCFQRGSPWLL